jgi:hypothetical protein
MDLKKSLYEIYLASPPNRFDAFIALCQQYYARPAHSLAELKSRDNKKIKGDIFEDFSVLYLQMKGYEAWRLEDVPESLLTQLNLKRRDMGIDIVCVKDGLYSAVQCKYLAPKDKRVGLPWRTLSTFYALCMRSGPRTHRAEEAGSWDKYIVMTNCAYVSRVGKKSDKDISFVLKSFQDMTSEEWLQMCGYSGTEVPEPTFTQTEKVLSPDELRAARLKRFS